MFKTILIPLDQSSIAEQALGVAESLARASGAELSLVLAHRMAPYNGSLVGSWSDAKDPAEAVYIRRLVEEIARGSHVVVNGTVSTGAPVETICRRINEVEADLVVMTSHGRTGVSRAWLGSVADGVVRSAPVPVLMLRAHEHRPEIGHGAPSPLFHRILVPLDGSTTSSAILPFAAAMAKAANAQLVLLRVVEPIPIVMFEPQMPAYSTGIEDPEATQRFLEEAEAELAELAPKIEHEYSLKAFTVAIVARDVAAAIRATAKTKQADLIAMTTHGRGTSRLFIGSVTDKVLRGSDLPLLLFHPTHSKTARAPGEKSSTYAAASQNPALVATHD